MPGTDQRGHTRARAPARKKSLRPANRRDPRPPGTLTGTGKRFTAQRVRSLRQRHKIANPTIETHPATNGATVTVTQAANELGVSTATVHRWLHEGFITGEQPTPGGPWQIRITPELRHRVCQDAPEG